MIDPSSPEQALERGYAISTAATIERERAREHQHTADLIEAFTGHDADQVRTAVRQLGITATQTLVEKISQDPSYADNAVREHRESAQQNQRMAERIETWTGILFDLQKTALTETLSRTSGQPYGYRSLSSLTARDLIDIEDRFPDTEARCETLAAREQAAQNGLDNPAEALTAPVILPTTKSSRSPISNVQDILQYTVDQTRQDIIELESKLDFERSLLDALRAGRITKALAPHLEERAIPEEQGASASIVDCFDSRIVNILERMAISTLEGLAQWTEAELAAIPNCGQGTVARIKDELHAHGLSLRDED